ncbi:MULTISPECIES: anaerobic ribonucleoside-triphosphate reductase [unclassified Clostridioides]|uniref:anaerobic ribonucleoside-triphosphate reductase n=1 Tax=unclassified Clostridioides TaxID=2635829 RepID=UPI001D129709
MRGFLTHEGEEHDIVDVLHKHMGGQAIPAFDFYNATSVRKTFIEEIKNIEIKDDVNLSHLYNIEIEDYITKDLKSLDNEKRNIQHAINRTVWRVHQSMESFIHNMNTIHSRGKLVTASLL